MRSLDNRWYLTGSNLTPNRRSGTDWDSLLEFMYDRAVTLRIFVVLKLGEVVEKTEESE